MAKVSLNVKSGLRAVFIMVLVNEKVIPVGMADGA
jgi:hypothetical protein